MQKFTYVLVAALVSLSPNSQAQIPPSPPVAPVKPVVTQYYGTAVTDNYRWMETDGKALAAYMKGQNAYTRAMLDSIPGRAPLLAEVSKDLNLASSTDAVIMASGKYFYLQIRPGQNTDKLYMRDARTGVTRLLLDPDKFSKSGGAVAINYFAPSQDGRYLAYGISFGGSEAATLHVLDTATLQDQNIAIDRVVGENPNAEDAGFLPVAWLPDHSFVYYRARKLGRKDDPNDATLKSRAYLHHLGQNPTGDGDVAVFGYDVDKSVPAAPNQDALPVSLPGSAYALGVLTENEEADTIDAVYITPLAALEAGKPVWRQVAAPADAVTAYAGAGGLLYLLSTHNAPHGKIVAMPMAAPDMATATTVLPESNRVIGQIGAAADGLYAATTDGGFSELLRIKNSKTAPVKLPYPGDADDVVTDPAASGAIYSLETWTHPDLWFRNDGTDTGIQPLAPVDTAQMISKEVMATSYDGTQIPLSIVMLRSTKLDGKNPTLLEGYGSYGLELTPYFGFGRLALLQRGGIIAFAHIRGGGWYGDAWHKAGMKLTKLNTVFDFIACAQYLEDNHYTSPAYLAGEGGSAGGITIGGAIDWAPQLFAVAIDSHGETDNLRSEFTPNGPPNIIEFGSVTTEPGFHGLYAMSAYVHVRDGTPYPAVLLLTGANDPRVAPWEVAKMAARLQAATSGKRPILLSVNYDSGHGMRDTKAQDAAEWADELSFIFWQTGNPAFQPK